MLSLRQHKALVVYPCQLPPWHHTVALCVQLKPTDLQAAVAQWAIMTELVTMHKCFSQLKWPLQLLQVLFKLTRRGMERGGGGGWGGLLDEAPSGNAVSCLHLG